MEDLKQIRLEEKLLNYLMHDKTYIGLATMKLRTEYFTKTKPIVNALLNFYAKYKDICPYDRIYEYVKVKHSNLLGYLEDSAEFEVASKADFEASVDDMVIAYKRRKIVEMAFEVADKNPKSCELSELEDLQNKINSIIADINMSGTESSKEGSVSASAQERLDTYMQIKENPEVLQLIDTGFDHINKSIVGWNKGGLHLVVGRKGDGKSVFLLNIAYHIWKQGLNVLLFSLEIDKAQYERRWDSRVCLVDSRSLKSGELTEEEEKNYKEYIEKSKQGLDMLGNKVGDLYIVDCPGSNITPSYILSKTEEVETKTGRVYDAIVIDYLNIMTSNNPTGVVREDLGQISLDLKRLARDKDKAVFSAVQMNREGKKNAEASKTGGMNDTASLAGSDSIADHADTIYAVRSLDNSFAIISSLKTRDGCAISFHIEKDYKHMRMIESDDTEWENL